ncbi:MAG TPA: protein kinase, partial [Terriglobales bacterium]|nr:protein kinase [Terriglobales bacterium]
MLGTSIGHYRVIERIGGGGMGVVYKAEDVRLGRFVALKFLPEEMAADTGAVERLRREARAISALNQPNICTLHDIGEEDGRTFLVMELLEGQNLRDRIADKGALPLPELLQIAVGLAEALEGAHEKGILHRDLKPANIFITRRGTAKVLDFGLAKMAGPKSGIQASHGTGTRDGDSQRTGGWALGTIAYMSPEQAMGRGLDERSDLFSLGAVLYEMATGLAPFRGDTTGAVFLSVVQERPVGPLELRGDLHTGLQQVIEKCLEKDPEKRYQHATEIARDLRALQEGPPLGATAPAVSDGKSARPQARKAWLRALHLPLKRKHRTLLAGLALIIVIVSGVFSYFYLHSRPIVLTNKDKVVLADFTNITGEAALDDALKQAARIDLRQSPYLNLLSDREVSDVLKRMDRPANQRLDRSVAREVCLRSNSRILISGTVSAIAGRYSLEMIAASCADGKVVASSRAEAVNRAELIQSLGKADEQLRERLGESLPSLRQFSQPLSIATTASLEALEAYTNGNRKVSRNAVDAIPEFERAIAIDPNFAGAYLELGVAYGVAQQSRLADENYRKAFELRHRLGELDRLAIEITYYGFATGETSKQSDAAEEMVRKYPNIGLGWNSVATTRYKLGNLDGSIEANLKAIQLASDAWSSYYNLMLAYVGLGRFDEARSIYDLSQTKNFDNEDFRELRFVLAFLQHDEAAMQEQVKWAAGRPIAEGLILNDLAEAEIYFGRAASARKISARARSAAIRDGSRDLSATYEMDAAHREAEIGNFAVARRMAEEALRTPTNSQVLLEAAATLAESGDSEGAERIIQDLRRDHPLDELLQNYDLPALRAIIELNHDRPDAALSILSQSARYDFVAGDDVDHLQPVYLRGLVYLKNKQGREAAAEFQKVLDHPGLTEENMTGALAHLQLGRAMLLTGDPQAARKHYEDFLSLWKDADPDIPI